MELRPEGRGPSHVEESDRKHQTEGTASAKVLVPVVFSSTAHNSNY